MLDFQAYPDNSLNPPAEPLPLRYNLDNIWGNGPATGTTAEMAAAPAAAPDDATRLNALLYSVPSYTRAGQSAAFASPAALVPDVVANLITIVPASYDGTFIPSASVRTVTPPDAPPGDVLETDKDVADALWSPPWAAVKGV